MKSGKLVLGVLAGLAAGAVLGILFAPDNGKKTRQKLIGGAKDLAEDLSKKIKDQVSTLRRKASDLESMADEKIEKFSSHTKHKADRLADTI